jgi:predicted nuclease with TOPRIM domain
MSSLRRLFNTPSGVQMSPGKKRVLYGPGPSLNTQHAGLTRVSAALAESRNLYDKMMQSEAHYRNTGQRYQRFINEWVRIHEMMQRQRNPSEALRRNLQAAQREINAANQSMKNIRRRGDKIADQWEKSAKRYRQLARRVIYPNGSRNLNNRLFTRREKEAIRASGAIVANMAAARRTVRRISLNQNAGSEIIRSMARR